MPSFSPLTEQPGMLYTRAAAVAQGDELGVGERGAGGAGRGGERGGRGAEAVRVMKGRMMVGANRTGLTVQERSRGRGAGGRTMYRDLSVLQETGVPRVQEKEGRPTLWKMMESSRWRMGTFHALSEVLALHIAAELLEASSGTPWRKALNEAIAQLALALPAMFAVRLEEVVTTAVGATSKNSTARAMSYTRRFVAPVVSTAASTAERRDIPAAALLTSSTSISSSEAAAGFGAGPTTMTTSPFRPPAKRSTSSTSGARTTSS